jgi:hypothetical protein
VSIVGKWLNLLFDTFRGTNYFSVHFCPAFCLFFVGSSSGPNVMKFLWHARLDDSKPL